MMDAQAAPSVPPMDFRLRPAKNIQRKMLCEAFQRLSAFAKLGSYRYIGFGGLHFSDFILFHKALGIEKMISIEREESIQDRFEFNRPFKSVDIHYGEATQVLPELDLAAARSILWLDYTRKLNYSFLADIRLFCARATSGSILVVTVNASPGPQEQKGASRLQRLSQVIGKDDVPPNVQEKDLAGWGTAEVCRTIISNAIKDTLGDRSGGEEDLDTMEYEQLFFSCYADTSKMLTTGGILYKRRDRPKLAACRFGDLPFVTTDAEPCLIEPPQLTAREIRHLEAQMPPRRAKVRLPGVPDEMLQKYAEVYRYFPMFGEAEV